MVTTTWEMSLAILSFIPLRVTAKNITPMSINKVPTRERKKANASRIMLGFRLAKTYLRLVK